MVSRRGRLLGVMERMFSMALVMMSRVWLGGANGPLRASWNVLTISEGKEWRKMVHASVVEIGGSHSNSR